MSDSVDRVFVRALGTVRRIPTASGNSRPPLEERLRLYGLYKQATEGDVEGIMERPSQGSSEEEAARQKWDAWNEQRGLSRTQAKRRYITALIESMSRHASSSAEARELISELEYVWDQIRDVPSSASSSPNLPQMAVHPPRYFDATGPPSRADMEEEDEAQRRWRRDIERALEKLRVEVTALREEIDSQYSQPRTRRISGGITKLVYFLCKHLAFDLAALFLLWVATKKQSQLAIMKHYFLQFVSRVRDVLRLRK